MKHQYETIIIVRPDITEDKEREVIRRYVEFLEDSGVRRTSSESWGRKKLAYPVKTFKEGYYHDFTFVSEESFIDDLNRKYDADDDIIKHIIVRNSTDEQDADEDWKIDGAKDDFAVELSSRDHAKPDSASQVVQQPDAMDVLLGFAHYPKPTSSK